MKFVNSVFVLALLVQGGYADGKTKQNARDLEGDFQYWKRYVQEVASLTPTDAPVMPSMPTDAPVMPTDAPVMPTDAPVMPTDGPVMPTDAPVMPTDGPVMPTDAPIMPTDAPVMPTDAPVAPTDAPVMPTDAPGGSPTDAPIMPTDAPVMPTEAPGDGPTDAPVMPTDAPVMPTEAPGDGPTDAPVMPTDAPVMPTEAPGDGPTDAPIMPTDAPGDGPTGAPVMPTEAPVAPTEAPVAPTDAPVAPVAPTDAPVAPTGPPTIQVKLTPHVPDGGADWVDPDSCRSGALARTEAHDGAETLDDMKLTQYYALYVIYECTNGVPNVITESDPVFDGIPPEDFPKWLIQTGWTDNSIDPCVAPGMHGIGCDAEGRIIEIDLNSNRLTGVWPAEVSMLSGDGPFATGAGDLGYIDVFGNEFLYNDGDMSWVADLGERLAFLFFGTTAFAGNLPPLLGGIIEFDGSFSLISGGLETATFQQAVSLNYAVLDGNAYNASIPTVLSTLADLEFLYVGDAFVSGTLDYMIGMTAMVENWVDNNPGLGGNIPPGVGSIGTLASFSVTNCALQGSLPTELGNLGSMQQMWYYRNFLTGQVPSEIGLLKTMTTFQVEGNDLTGTMPAEICFNAGALGALQTLGADCFDGTFTCDCCTCCSLELCGS